MAATAACQRPSALSGFSTQREKGRLRNFGSGKKRSGHSQTAQELKQFPGNYFGGGVVVPPELFLPFLPPLWALLVLLAFLPVVLGVVSVVLVGEPVVAWANARLPASNIVNTTVNSFFMQISFKGKFRVTQSNPILRKSFVPAAELN
jgi:hypothetical protein